MSESEVTKMAAQVSKMEIDHPLKDPNDLDEYQEVTMDDIQPAQPQVIVDFNNTGNNTGSLSYEYYTHITQDYDMETTQN